MNISSLFGGGSTIPIGGVIPLYGYNSNPIIDGMEFLKCSVYKAYTSDYSHLLNTDLPVINPTNASSCVNVDMAFFSSRYYAFGVNSSVYSTGNGTWTALTNGLGGTTHHWIYTPTKIVKYTTRESTYLHTNITGTTESQVDVREGTVYVLVGKPDGSIISSLGMANAANDISVSTNGGSAFTDYTSGLGAIYPINAEWISSENKFVYIYGNGKAYTTTNGYTLTDVGYISPSSYGIATTSLSTLQRANNGTTYIFLMNVGGSVSIVKTTNGTSFTITPLSDITGVVSTTVPMISYGNGLFTMVGYTAGLESSNFGCWKSSDGITWTKFPPLISTAIRGLNYFNGSWSWNYSGGGYLHATTSTLDTTHIGVPAALDISVKTATTQVVSYYVRIK